MTAKISSKIHWSQGKLFFSTEFVIQEGGLIYSITKKSAKCHTFRRNNLHYEKPLLTQGSPPKIGATPYH